jgi:hypothetical protein
VLLRLYAPVRAANVVWLDARFVSYSIIVKQLQAEAASFCVADADLAPS